MALGSEMVWPEALAKTLQLLCVTPQQSLPIIQQLMQCTLFRCIGLFSTIPEQNGALCHITASKIIFMLW